MAVADETVRLAKAILRDDENLDVKSFKEQRFNKLFGNNANWVNDGDSLFETNFVTRLTDDDASEFTTSVGAATDENGVKSLLQWFERLLDRWANDTRSGASAQEPPSGGPRFTNLAQVQGYPGWWMGFDTTEQTPDDQWKYVRSTAQPTDATTGWMTQAAAFEAMQGAAQASASPGPASDAAIPVSPGETLPKDVEDILSGIIDEILEKVPGATDASAEEFATMLEEALQREKD